MGHMLTFGLAPYNLYMYTPTIRVSKGFFNVLYPIRTGKSSHSRSKVLEHVVESLEEENVEL